MPILDLQRRLREAGRIRLGAKDPERGFPKRLTTLRFTSRDQTIIGEVAGLYGGTPREWKDAPTPPQWEVTTKVDRVPVVVPPADLGFSQWWELWSGGGCVRRCDGQTMILTDEPCLCDPENRECSPHTRLSVMLPDLPSVGLWRLDTQGWNAATELAGSVDLALAFANRGTYLPAELRLEQREQKKVGEQIRKFVVPVLDLKVSMRELTGVARGALEVGTGDNGTAPGGEPASFTPVPAHLPTTPVRSIEEQLAPREPRIGGRKAVPIPGSGLEPGATAVVAPPSGGGPEDAQSEEPADVTDEPPPDNQAALPLASRVAIWIADITPTDEDSDDFRHRFLEAVTEGQITSAKDFPEDSTAIAALRTAIGRYEAGEIVLRPDEAVFRTTTSPPTVTPVVELFPDYDQMKVGELAALCRQRGLTPTGLKADLIATLKAADQ